MTAAPLDLEAAERRIYGPPGGPGVPYTHIVLREVPLLLAEIRRLRALEGTQEATSDPESAERTITEQECGSSPSGPQKGAGRCGVDALNCVLTTVVERTDIDWATVYEDDDT